MKAIEYIIIATMLILPGCASVEQKTLDAMDHVGAGVDLVGGYIAEPMEAGLNFVFGIDRNFDKYCEKRGFYTLCLTPYKDMFPKLSDRELQPGEQPLGVVKIESAVVNGKRTEFRYTIYVQGHFNRYSGKYVVDNPFALEAEEAKIKYRLGMIDAPVVDGWHEFSQDEWGNVTYR